LFEHVFVVIEVFLVEQPGHAISLAIHCGDIPGSGEDLILHVLGDTVGGIQGVAGFGKLGVPDIVDQEDVVGRRLGSHGGRDLVVQCIVSHILDLDLDIRVGLVELADDGIHFIHRRPGLLHGQHADGGRPRGCLRRAAYDAGDEDHRHQQHER
jgi:hypothetical protein